MSPRLLTWLLALSVISVSHSRNATSSSFCKSREASCILEGFGYSPNCVISALSTCEEQPFYSALETEMRGLKDAIAGLSTGSGKGAHRPRHCADLKSVNEPSGIYKIYPKYRSPDYPMEVFCDQTTEGGGWTVIQRRSADIEKREDFNRQWIDYVLGFGYLDAEFWLGLEYMHVLTSSTLMELRIDLEDFAGIKSYAKYSKYYVGDSSSKYQLHVGKYTGIAGDALSYNNKMFFTTSDMDNDGWKEENCAHSRDSAWWYNFCSNVDLNGFPYNVTPPSEWFGIYYQPFRGSNYSLKSVAMLIRPAFILT